MAKAANTMFVTGFTRATKYQHLSERLLKSMNEFGLNYLAMSYEPSLEWTENCAVKPSLIEKAMKVHDGPVVWIDADAELISYPYEMLSVPEDSYDFAAREVSETGESKYLTSSIWFSGSENSKAMVQKWSKFCGENRQESDQENFAKVATSYSGFKLSKQSCFVPEIDSEFDSPSVVHQPINLVNKDRGQKQDLQFYKHLSEWLSTVASAVNIEGQSTQMSNALSLYMDLTRAGNAAVAVDTCEMKDGLDYLVEQLYEWEDNEAYPKRAAFMLSHIGERPTVLDVKKQLEDTFDFASKRMTQEATSIPGKSLWLFDFQSADPEASTVS